MMNSSKFLACLALTAGLLRTTMAVWRDIDDFTDLCDQNAKNHNGKTNREVCEEMHQFCVAYNVTDKWDDDQPWDDQPFDDEVDFRCQLAVKCKNDNDCAGHSYQGTGELKCIKDFKFKWTYWSEDDNEMNWKSSEGQCGISSRAIFQSGCDQERTSSSERRLGSKDSKGTAALLVYNNLADMNAYDCNHVEENNKTIEENCASLGKACMNISFTQTWAVDDDDYEFPGRRHFKSAVCEVPLYYCDEYDCESMGYVCGSGNYSKWDDDDYMSHFDRPFCVEELQRKGYTSSSRTRNRTETRLAVPLNCEGVPTAAPTMAPTLSTTTSVAVEFDITASAPPTNADKTALKESIANATGVTTDEVKNFAVTATSARRLGEKSSRRLTVYTWTVDCDIVAADLGSTTSAEFETAVSADLSATSFTNNVLAKVSSATGVSAITTVAASRNPTMAPTMVPIPAPTMVPIPAPTMVPIPAPTMVPIPAPTMVPIPAPTMVPIPAPTMVPTVTPKDDDDADMFSTGALAGIIVGGFVGILFIGGAIFLLTKSRTPKDEPAQNPTFEAGSGL